jgi:hypothetical protein
MLSPESTAVVKATLPAVGAAIEEITTVFYATLFADHPALERDLFNRGNQAQGDQQRALAGAIAAFATILVAEDGPPPDRVLSRIANKHASNFIHDNVFEDFELTVSRPFGDLTLADEPVPVLLVSAGCRRRSCAPGTPNSVSPLICQR